MSRQPGTRSYAVSLAFLCLVGFLTTVDRLAFPLVIEPIRHDFGLSDTQIGLLTGMAFTAMYAVASIPVARWADSGDRRMIIALSIGVWSIMTSLCGMAQSVWQLFAARFGVGFGEAGANAPVQSLITDYYPPDRRSLPLALLGLGAATGGILGYALVGVAADRLGWRHGLMVLSLPGILVALLIHRFVVEPRDLAPARIANTRPPFGVALAGMLRKRAFVHISIGFAIWGIAAQGTGQWLPTFFIRTYSMPLTKAGLLLGIVIGGALCVGLLLGGVLGNLVLKRDIRWGLWLPALGMTCYAFFTFGALLGPSLNVTVILLFLGASVGGVVVAPLLATTSGLVRPDVRTVSLAVMGLLASVLGGGLGPLAIGALSDEFKKTFGLQSLRYSLALATLPMLWAALHLYWASRHLRQEFEDRVGVEL